MKRIEIKKIAEISRIYLKMIDNKDHALGNKIKLANLKQELSTVCRIPAFHVIDPDLIPSIPRVLILSGVIRE